ncbi:MAG: DUF222 domain-containing protein, partial [Gemmatimonadota bacterium]
MTMYAVRMCAVRERVAWDEAWAGAEPAEPRRPRPPWLRLVRETAVQQGYEATDDALSSTAPDPAPGEAVLGEDPEDEDPTAEDPEDELFLLGERCAEAYLQADALQYRAMTLLAEFHHREGWRDTGFGSTAEWLAWRIGIKPNAARERVRTALALEHLPETSEAMRRGELSFTKVRTLTRAATPDNETTLLEFARSGSAANLERVIRGWQTLGDRKSELTAEQIRHRRRRFSAWVDDDGTVVVRGRLDPEVGAVLMRAVEAANDALFRRGEGQDGEDVTAVTSGAGSEAEAELETVTPEQRRADALGLVAERALAAGFGGRGAGDDDDEAPISGSRAERYQVMLHV